MVVDGPQQHSTSRCPLPAMTQQCEFHALAVAEGLIDIVERVGPHNTEGFTRSAEAFQLTADGLDGAKVAGAGRPPHFFPFLFLWGFTLPLCAAFSKRALPPPRPQNGSATGGAYSQRY